MPAVIEYSEDGKPKIKRVETFCSLLNNLLPLDGVLYKDLLDSFDKLIMDEHPKVTKGALSNCHGDWYEWLLAVNAWNYRILNDRNFILLLLPNVSSLDVGELYNDGLNGYLQDLRKKVKDSADVQLITSNPDFVIIDTSNINLDDCFNKSISELTPETIRLLEKSYEHFIGKCSFENIVGYLSVKTSFRPDRRLQLSHEGSLMKATYAHLQTRDWVINPVGLKYYGAATMISDADRRGLRTVATHSIINVQSTPQAAVDEIFAINSNALCNSAFSTIFSK